MDWADSDGDSDAGGGARDAVLGDVSAGGAFGGFGDTVPADEPGAGVISKGLCGVSKAPAGGGIASGVLLIALGVLMAFNKFTMISR